MANKKRKLASEASSPPDPKRKKQENDNDLRFRIPHHLKEIITRISPASRNSKDHEFTFEYSLNSLTSVHTLAWGIEDTVESIIVRVKFFNSGSARPVGFCVHDSVDEERTNGHQFCLNTDKKPNQNICTTRPNILTCVIGLELYDLFGSAESNDVEKLTLKDIHLEINRIILSDSTAACIICNKVIGVKIWSPTACSDRCKKELEQWPLPARLSHLLTDVKTLDLLLCCVNSAAQFQNDPGFLGDCPVAHNQIPLVIDSFPKDLSQLRLISEVDSKKQTAYHDERQKLLSWICSRFCGSMVSLPRQTNFYVDSMSGAHQFLLLNSHMERHEKFLERMSAAQLECGSVAFHGTPGYHAFNILTQGLKANHIGLFYAPEPSISLRYSARHGPAGHLQPWRNSAFQGSRYLVLFGCEVSRAKVRWRDHGTGTGQPFEHSTHDENKVMIRYIFLCPLMMPTPPAMDMRRTMENAYTALNEGELAYGDIEPKE